MYCKIYHIMSVVVYSREFRDNQKKYLDLVDENEQVIVKRKNGKAYALVPVSESYFLDPKNIERLKHSIAQAESGEVAELTPERQRELLGL